LEKSINKSLRRLGNPVHGKRLIWDASLEEKYDTFGYIEYGVVCQVYKKSIEKNGQVIEKGLVKK
jgi:hypothetical protein